MAIEDVAKAPGSCELNKALNRDWAIQVKPVGAEPSEYEFVPGLDSISVNIETSTVDASDLDSDGWESVEKTSRKLVIAIAGKYAVLKPLNTAPKGQQLLIDTGMELGADGKVDVRVWRTDGTDEAWETTATNQFSSEGGGSPNELRAFTANLQSSCAPTRIKPVVKGGVKSASVPAGAAAEVEPSSS